MPAARVDLPEKENRLVSVYAAENGFSNKPAAILDIIRKYFGVENEREKEN